MQPNSLVVFLALNNRENAVDIYNIEVEGEEGTGTKNPNSSSKAKITNNLCAQSMISYHPSKALQQICQKTGARV